MTQEQPTNFNREIDQMLTQSEQRIEQLRELNRPLRPWEKERLKERLSKLENHQTWDKAYLQEQLTQRDEADKKAMQADLRNLESQLNLINKRLYIVMLILLGICGLFALFSDVF